MEIMKNFIKQKQFYEIMENTRRIQDNAIFHIRQVIETGGCYMQNAKRRGEENIEILYHNGCWFCGLGVRCCGEWSYFFSVRTGGWLGYIWDTTTHWELHSHVHF
jgi:hypothetical protein